MSDKICPLRNTICGEDCAWYIEVISNKSIYGCILIGIAYGLDDIKEAMS